METLEGPWDPLVPTKASARRCLSPYGGWGSWPPVSLPWSHLGQLRAPPRVGLQPLSHVCIIYCSPQENGMAGPPPPQLEPSQG